MRRIRLKPHFRKTLPRTITRHRNFNRANKIAAKAMNGWMEQLKDAEMEKNHNIRKFPEKRKEYDTAHRQIRRFILNTIKKFLDEFGKG